MTAKVLITIILMFIFLLKLFFILGVLTFFFFFFFLAPLQKVGFSAGISGQHLAASSFKLFSFFSFK